MIFPADKVAPNVVPMMSRVKSSYPMNRRVAVEVWQHTTDRRNPLQRALREKLEACGWAVVDVRTAISHDLPILSFLATADSLTAVLTDITASESGRRRGCIWRERFELRGVTHAKAAAKVAETFVATRK